MSERETEGLVRLHRDLQAPDLPSPELLARYANAPNELEPEERAEVERAMAASAVVVDELDTLRGFDFAALNADRVAAGEGADEARGFVGWLRYLLVGRPEIWAAIAAAVVLSFWLTRPDGVEDGARDTPPQLVQQERESRGSMPGPRPGPDASGAPGSSDEVPPTPRVAPPDPAPLEEAGQQLAMQPSEPVSPGEVPRNVPRMVQREVPLPPAPQPRAPDAPRPAPETAPIAPDPVAPSEPAEVLLAMNMPAYQPAFGTDMFGIESWVERGERDGSIGIVAAVPDHVTRSSVASPTLHWSLERVPESGVFHLTILDEEDEPVVLDRVVTTPTARGLQRLDLAALGVALPEGKVLRWSVAYRESAEAPPTSFDFGWLKVEALDAADRARLAAASEGERVSVLAELGCYSEALEAALKGRARAVPGAREAVGRLLGAAGVKGSSLE